MVFRTYGCWAEKESRFHIFHFKFQLSLNFFLSEMANHASEDRAEATKQTLNKNTTKPFVSARPHIPD